MGSPPFHLAFPVNDLEQTRRFYVDVLGCGVGRENERWIDFDFHGHQITAHLSRDKETALPTNPVDGSDIPVRHFGAVLEWDAWEALSDRIAASGGRFAIAPRIRFAGQVGEQGTFFVTDPSGNYLEFKAFRDPARLFATE
ncbi:MAG: VOC family protein [Pseudomonadota bacterium]|nr:MAG: VOC family protein [Pseudomonadota bacterium]